MRRVTMAFAAALILFQVALPTETSAQETRRPKAPVLTSEDLLSPGASATSAPVERPLAVHSPETKIKNARSVLERALTRMAEVKSVRTRIKTFLAGGPREVLIESVKPDRTHVVGPEGEMIVIGSEFYMKSNGEWQLTRLPRNKGALTDSGLEFGELVKQLIGKSNVSITGFALGEQVVDGVDSLVYDFEISDQSEAGSIQMSVGKGDGYIRRLSISGGPATVQGGSGLTITVWFTNINEPISIQPPI